MRLQPPEAVAKYDRILDRAKAYAQTGGYLRRTGCAKARRK